MEDLYRNIDPSFSCSEEVTGIENFNQEIRFHDQIENKFQFEANETKIHGSDIPDLIKSQIANHPRYPSLLSAYIECQKVGLPSEMASLLEEIGLESRQNGGCSKIGADPELDKFMESYCEVLLRYKEELSKPFVEATTFLSKIETQLSNLCKGNSSTTNAASSNRDEAVGSSEEDLSCGELEASEGQETYCHNPGDEELKQMLLRKYSGYLSSLRKEFLKKRKKGKLSKEARMVLLDWWNSHYRWPYPTEEEKMKLAEMTELDQKQINNWFINQRKRHWKPSDDMRFSVMEGVSVGGGGGSGPPVHWDTRGTVAVSGGGGGSGSGPPVHWDTRGTVTEGMP